MDILYIERGLPKTSFLKTSLRRIKRHLVFGDQDGFFEQSLHAVSNVTRISIEDEYKETYNKQFDLLLINWKQPIFSTEEERLLAIKEMMRKCDLPKVLFVNAANANYLPQEEVLDAFDLIVKREPCKDKDRYAISENNKRKIVPTIIHCPFFPSPKNNFIAKSVNFFRPEVALCDSKLEIYEVGFTGADAQEHTLRQDVWSRIVQENFSTIGGLQPNPYSKLPIPKDLVGPRFIGKSYRDSLCQAKINLALDGIGQYTFRHQELLYLGKFILSSGSIRDQDLVIPLKEDIHYVAFDTLDQMVEKVHYYLKHEGERQAIATAGKKLFDEYYDPRKHGQTLLARLKKV